MLAPVLSQRLILIGAATWHAASAMSMILIPLYADYLGFSALAVGSLISAPIVVHISMRLVGGVLVERLGEKTLLVACFLAMALAGPIFLVADTFVILLLATATIVLSRSVYYVAAQSYITRVPGAAGFGARLGHLNAANHAGAIVGVVSAGVLIATTGFTISFLVFTGVAAAAIVCGFLMPSLPRAGARRSIGRIARTFLEFAGRRQIYLCLLCGFGAALPASLSHSFYPLYVTHLGYGGEITGLVVAFHSVGSIGQGMFIARHITLATHKMFFRLGFLGLGSSLALTSVSTEAALIALLVGLTGISGGTLDMCYQTLAAYMSSEENRAAAFAVAGLGWSLSHLIVPVTFGALVEFSGYSTAFLTYGIVLVTLALSASLVYRALLNDDDRRALERVGAAATRPHA